MLCGQFNSIWYTHTVMQPPPPPPTSTAFMQDMVVQAYNGSKATALGLKFESSWAK